MSKIIKLTLPDAEETFIFDFFGKESITIENLGDKVTIPISRAEAFMIRDTLGGIRRFVDELRLDFEKEEREKNNAKTIQNKKSF